jgi:hypothetical protein
MGPFSVCSRTGWQFIRLEPHSYPVRPQVANMGALLKVKKVLCSSNIENLIMDHSG